MKSSATFTKTGGVVKMSEAEYFEKLNAEIAATEEKARLLRNKRATLLSAKVLLQDFKKTKGYRWVIMGGRLNDKSALQATVSVDFNEMPKTVKNKIHKIIKDWVKSEFETNGKK